MTQHCSGSERAGGKESSTQRQTESKRWRERPCVFVLNHLGLCIDHWRTYSNRKYKTMLILKWLHTESRRFHALIFAIWSLADTHTHTHTHTHTQIETRDLTRTQHKLTQWCSADRCLQVLFSGTHKHTKKDTTVTSEKRPLFSQL